MDVLLNVLEIALHVIEIRVAFATWKTLEKKKKKKKKK